MISFFIINIFKFFNVINIFFQFFYYKFFSRPTCDRILRGCLHKPGLTCNPGQLTTPGFLFSCLHEPGLVVISDIFSQPGSALLNPG